MGIVDDRSSIFYDIDEMVVRGGEWKKKHLHSSESIRRNILVGDNESSYRTKCCNERDGGAQKDEAMKHFLEVRRCW